MAALAAGLLMSACGGDDETPPAEETLPDAARVVCDGETTRVETPEIRPQRDGVHIEIENTTDTELVYSVTGRDGRGHGDGAAPGDTAVVSDVPPGQVEIACHRGATDPERVASATFRVTDEDGIWVSDVLDCQSGKAVAGTAFVLEGEGGMGPPVEIVERQFEDHLRAGDVIEDAGYPEYREDEEAVVSVMRDADVVAVVHFLSDGEGGWLRDSYEACREF